jgi:hypothetical protein
MVSRHSCAPASLGPTGRPLEIAERACILVAPCRLNPLERFSLGLGSRGTTLTMC